MSFPDADHIVENWTFYDGGVQKGATTIKLKRVAASDKAAASTTDSAHRYIDKKKLQ